MNRAKILNKLAELHRAGIHHLDFAERNVVKKNGDYRIIDLRHIVEHESECCWTYDFEEHIGDRAPDAEDPCAQCHIIAHQARLMRFWETGM